MDFNYHIAICEKWLPAFEQLRQQDQKALHELQTPGRQLRRADHNEIARLKAEIFLIEEGCGPMDGTTSDQHRALLENSEIRSLTVVRPGIATLRTYHARLCEKRDVQLAKERARTA